MLGSTLGEGNGQQRTWVPSVDVWETENEIVYAFDVLGIPEDKISVELRSAAASPRRSRATRRSNSASLFPDAKGGSGRPST